MTGPIVTVDVPMPAHLAPHLPADPRGLIALASFFDAQGYARLASYLRSCADHIAMGAAPPVTAAVLNAEGYHARGATGVRVYLGGDQDQVHAIRLGESYALIHIPRPEPQEAGNAHGE